MQDKEAGKKKRRGREEEKSAERKYYKGKDPLSQTPGPLSFPPPSDPPTPSTPAIQAKKHPENNSFFSAWRKCKK